MPGESGATEPQREPGEASARLDSWKEIAAYLKRDPRTIRRWEREEGLPVHRHLHGKRATVYAFTDQIDTWLVGRRVSKGAHQLPQDLASELSPGRASEALQKEPASRPLIIAILPLRTLSGDVMQERFADGLTEELILEVGQCCPNRLRVIALTSVMQYKQSPKNIAEIGRELGADYVLEGTIRRYGRRVRLTARLIAARDQAHVWADSYEVQLPSIFALQQSLARELADSLASELKVKPIQRQPRAIVRNTEAHSVYLEGRSYFLPTDEDIKKKLECLLLAIERDPRFAPGYAELALVYFPRLYRDYPPIVALSRMKEYSLRALKLDWNLARAHTAMAASHLFGAWDWTKAEKSSRRAIELNPSDVWAHIVRAAYYLVVGEPEQAVEELEQAHQLDPQSVEHGIGIAHFTYLARRYDLALKRCQEVIQLDPSLPVAHGLLGLCYAQMGDPALSLSSSGEVTEVGTDPIVRAAMASSVYAMTGHRDSAERLLQELVAAQENRYVRYFFLALASVGLGNDKLTLKWLEKACEQRDPLVVFLKASPRFESLAGLPGFRNLLRRIGLPP
jgi:TolB-like protein/Flp pilus assembly protein TadD